jgi:hypothetical protein
MSLEEKLANLALDDAPVVVGTVQKEGVEKSGLAANVSVLAARCDSNDEKEALAALKIVKDLAEQCPESHAFIKECLSACKSNLRRGVFSEGSWLRMNYDLELFPGLPSYGAMHQA